MGAAMRAGKIQRFETLESSTLSNSYHRLLNYCRSFGQLLLPQSCCLCAAPAAEAFCAACWHELPWLPAARCRVCAVPLASGATCGACLDRPPRFERVEAVFAYRFPVDALVHAFKYGNRLALARPLGGRCRGRSARRTCAAPSYATPACAARA
jgi:hypothetical protein